MPKSEHKEKAQEAPQREISVKDLNFKCHFCGESKPLSTMVILRQYYPPKNACKECAKRM